MATVTDQLGRTLNLIDKPKRIVSLVPSITELLFDLGLDEEVVGVTKFCIHPGEKTFDRKKIGGTKQLNIEDILALEPDIIYANKEENVEEQIDELAKSFPVWISNVNNIPQAHELILSIGEMVNKNKAADILSKRIKGEFDKLELHLPESPRKVAYLIWKEPYMVAASNTFINDILYTCGFENAYNEQERYPEVTGEALTNSGADLILLSTEPFPFKDDHFAEFRALCPDAKVFLVNGEIFSWYGSHLLKTPSYMIAFWRSLQLLGG